MRTNSDVRRATSIDQGGAMFISAVAVTPRILGNWTRAQLPARDPAGQSTRNGVQGGVIDETPATRDPTCTIRKRGCGQCRSQETACGPGDRGFKPRRSPVWRGDSGCEQLGVISPHVGRRRRTAYRLMVSPARRVVVPGGPLGAGRDPGPYGDFGGVHVGNTVVRASYGGGDGFEPADLDHRAG